jgi:hypothetical protein
VNIDIDIYRRWTHWPEEKNSNNNHRRYIHWRLV